MKLAQTRLFAAFVMMVSVLAVGCGGSQPLTPRPNSHTGPVVSAVEKTKKGAQVASPAIETAFVRSE